MNTHFLHHLCKSLVILALVANTGFSESDEKQALQQFQASNTALAKADQIRDDNNLPLAAHLYRAALASHIKLLSDHPSWQPNVIKFRVAYCNDQLKAVEKQIEIKRIKKAQTVQAPPPQPQPQPQPLAPIEIEEPEEFIADDPPLSRDRGMGSPEEQLAMSMIQKRARQLLDQQEAQEARKVLLDGLTIDPDDMMIRLLISIAQCQIGQFDDALYVLDELLTEMPSNACVLVVKAAAHFGNGMNDEAEDLLNKAIAIDPNLSDAHYNIARIKMSSNPPDIIAVRLHYNKARELGANKDQEFEELFKTIDAQLVEQEPQKTLPIPTPPGT